MFGEPAELNKLIRLRFFCCLKSFTSDGLHEYVGELSFGSLCILGLNAALFYLNLWYSVTFAIAHCGCPIRRRPTVPEQPAVTLETENCLIINNTLKCIYLVFSVSLTTII